MTQEENLFVSICSSEDIGPGEEKVFRSNGRSVLIIRSAEADLFAVEDNCPHANTNISGGRFRGGFYACPHHGARFELSTGKSMTNLSNKPLVCFDIKEEDIKFSTLEDNNFLKANSNINKIDILFQKI